MEHDSELLRLEKEVTSTKLLLFRTLALHPPSPAWVNKLSKSLERKQLELAKYVESHPSSLNCALYRDGAGNLYGTTKFGGAYGAGTVFKIMF